MARQPVANPAPTFTKEALAALIAQATQEALAKQRAEFEAAMREMQAKQAEAKPATSKSAANEMAAVRAFKKAGFGTVKPHEDVRTFNKWIEAGLRPMEGSKSVKVANLRLFHRSQCRPLTKDDQAKMKEQKAAHDSRKGNAAKGPKVVPINGQAVMPV